MLETIPLYLTTFCRVVIGLTFLLSAFSKLQNFAAFKEAIRNFRIVPPHAIDVVAIVITVCETTVVVLMGIGRYGGLWGFLLAGTMLIIFSISLLYVLTHKIHTSCNCFSPSQKKVSQYDVWRNLGLITCTVIGAVTFLASEPSSIVLNLFEWSFIGLIAGVFITAWLNISTLLSWLLD